MPVREHHSQHEAAEELPLVTDGARVTDVEALDRNRSEAVREAIAAHLREDGREEWVHGDGNTDPEGEENAEGVAIDWDPVREYADSEGDDALTDLIDRYDRPYPALLRVRVAPDSNLAFAAGQYVTLGFEDTPRPYSVANAPGEGDLEFCIRRVPGGRLTSDLFTELDPGDHVTVRGPSGEFVLQEPSERDLVFLATGTGVAPLKSMLEYTLREGRDVVDGSQRDIWLFLGAGWVDDLPYHDHFSTLAAEHDHVHYVPTLTREPLLTDWDGETEYVQRVLVKYVATDPDATLDGDLAAFLDREPATDVEARIDPANIEVYACGVTAMVNTLVDTVAQLGTDEKFVDAEGFG